MNELTRKILERNGVESNRRLYESSLREDEDQYKEYMRRMKDNATYKKIESLCTKYGYRLGGATATSRGSKKDIELRIIDDRPTYHPPIYYTNYMSSFGKDPEFEIQTIAVGSLVLTEYEKYLKGCQDAYNLVSELDKIDLTTLYDPSVDYPDEE